MGGAPVLETLVGRHVEAEVVVRVEQTGVEVDVLVLGFAHLFAERACCVACDLHVQAFGHKGVALSVLGIVITLLCVVGVRGHLPCCVGPIDLELLGNVVRYGDGCRAVGTRDQDFVADSRGYSGGEAAGRAEAIDAENRKCDQRQNAFDGLRGVLAPCKQDLDESDKAAGSIGRVPQDGLSLVI